MSKAGTFVAIALFACACNAKRSEEEPMPAGSAQAMGSGGSGGSAGSGSAGSGSAGVELPPGSPLAVGAKFSTCWAAWNAANWDAFKACYAPNAVSEMPGSILPNASASSADAIVAREQGFRAMFPDAKGTSQLVLISPHALAALTLVTGTNTGPAPLPGQLSTGKKIGLLVAQYIDLDDKGLATHERIYVDSLTMLGQLGLYTKHPVRAVMTAPENPGQIVISNGDATETKNLKIGQEEINGFSNHDMNMLDAIYAPAIVWSEQAEDKDLDKKAALATTAALQKGMSDAKLVPDQQWAAGSYVVTIGTLQGTNDGELAMLGIHNTKKKVDLPFFQIDHLDNGKIDHAWLLYQSAGFAKQLGVELLPPPPKPAGESTDGKAGSGAKH